MIRARVDSIVPGAGYQGRTFDQWVTASIDDSKLKIFDSTVMAAADSHIGRECELSLLLQPSSVERTDNKVTGIDQTGDDIVLFIGNITNLPSPDETGDKSSLEMNIGLGTVSVASTSELIALQDTLTKGDQLRISAYRVDLIDIEYAD